jgi:WS/DGAT/MGAT family acyltransferase
VWDEVMKQISGMDDFFLHFERSGLPMHVGSVALYQPPTFGDRPPSFAEIRESIRRGVARSPLLRQRLVSTPLHLDRPHWVDASDFPLDDHIHRVSLPDAASWDQLRSMVARIFEKPLDLARPLFEVTVIEDLRGIEGMPAAAFALVTKVHHSVLDGVSGVEVMEAFCDASADIGAAEREHEEIEPEPSTATLLGRAWLNQIGRGVGVAKLAATSLRMLVGRETHASSRGPTRTQPDFAAHTLFNDRPSSARVFGGCHLRLSDVQAIRDAVPGATVNDVILTVVGGALRRMLSERSQLPSNPIAAMAPISIRSSEDVAGAGVSGGNRVSMMVVGLGTDVADPLERLEAVHQTALASKKTSSAAGSNTLLDVANVIPSALGELAARAYRGLGLSSLHPAFFSCVVTNVPGPKEPLYLAGSRMIACYGLGPIFDGVGLIHPVLSYDGGITIAFTSCPEMLPDPARYEECLRESFEELAAAGEVRPTADIAAVGQPGR